MTSRPETRITNAHVSDFRPESQPFNTEKDNYRIDCEMAVACVAGTLMRMNPATGKTEQAMEYHFLSKQAVEHHKARSIKHPTLIAQEKTAQARIDARIALAEERPSSFGPTELRTALGRTMFIGAVAATEEPALSRY